MSKVAPDTRNKIDSQRDLKVQKRTKKVVKKATLQQFQQAVVFVKEEKSKGQLFKELHGYSKTMKRNLKKHDLDVMSYSDALNEYRGIVKKRRLAEKKVRQEKHSTAVAKRKTKASPVSGKKKAA